MIQQFTKVSARKKWKDMFTPRLIGVNVHSSVIRDGYKAGAIQMSIIRHTDTQHVVCPYSVILFSNKKGTKRWYRLPCRQTSKTYWVKKARCKIIDWMIRFLWNVQKRQFCRDRKLFSGCLGLRGRVGIDCKQVWGHIGKWWNVPEPDCDSDCTAL